MDDPNQLLGDMTDEECPRTIGYTRIGPTDKEADAADLIMADLMFTDQVGSQTTEPRPQLEACLNALKPGDQFIALSIDRLARNTKELAELVERITDIGVSIRFMNEGIDLKPNRPGFEEKMSLIKGIHDAQQSLIVERRKEGLIKAKKKGIRLGRPTKLTDENRAQIRERLWGGEKAPSLAKEFGVSESLVYQIGRSK